MRLLFRFFFFFFLSTIRTTVCAILQHPVCNPAPPLNRHVVYNPLRSTCFLPLLLGFQIITLPIPPFSVCSRLFCSTLRESRTTLRKNTLVCLCVRHCVCFCLTPLHALPLLLRFDRCSFLLAWENPLWKKKKVLRGDGRWRLKA